MNVSSRPGLIGAKVQRLEDPRLLCGLGQFVDDIMLTGCLHLAFVRSTQAHAQIKNIETCQASTLAGVRLVISGRELADAYSLPRATSRMRDYHATGIPALAIDKVRYVGEPVVAVVAESRAIAEDAAELISIDYADLEAFTCPFASARDTALRLFDDARSNVLLTRQFGNQAEAEKAIMTAPLVVEGRFHVGRKAPAAIENRTYLADFDAGRRALTVYSSTQVPGIIRDALCEVLDIPGSRLRVVAPDVGGGFGCKASLYPEEMVVSLLSRRLGRPVKWQSDRLEDLTSTNQAFDEHVDARLAVASDGTLLGLLAEVTGDIGAYSVYPWTAALEPVQVVSFLPGPYRLPAYFGRVRGVATNKAPTGPYRGVGRPVSTFVMERLIDMAARRLDIDAVQMRRKNLVRPDEMPYRAGSGLVWNHADFGACLEAACKQVSYDDALVWRETRRSQGCWAGIGFASYAELTGIGSRISAAPGMPINTGTESATLSIDSTGGITAAFGVASHGQGLETTLAQIVAEELGVEVEDVVIVHGDSAAVAHGTGTYASRSTVLAGGAATLGARSLREKVIFAASHLMEAATEDIEIEAGQIRVKGTDRAMDFKALAKGVYSEMGRLPKEVRESIELEVTRMYDPFFGTTTPATHIALVEIDPQTFDVRLERYAVAEDCGRVINPLIVDGQVQGGVAQGIGAALLEEVVYNDEGQILTATFADYLLPSAVEVPNIDIAHVQTGEPDNVGGFRGLGEGGTIGAPAAIANAISDALSHLDIEITEVPVTPVRLFELVENARHRTDGETA